MRSTEKNTTPPVAAADSSKKEDRRIRRTRRLLKQGLAELMQEKDFKDISVKDVTDRMDLNRGTFYLHFRDLYDLLDTVENDVLRDLQSIMDAYRPSPKKDTLLPMLAPISQYVHENENICRILFESSATQDFIYRLRDMISQNGKALIKERFPDAQENVMTNFLSFITYGVIGLIRQWFDNGLDMPTDELIVMADRVIWGAAERLLEGA